MAALLCCGESSGRLGLEAPVRGYSRRGCGSAARRDTPRPAEMTTRGGTGPSVVSNAQDAVPPQPLLRPRPLEGLGLRVGRLVRQA
jgi:hypothetical protein